MGELGCRFEELVALDEAALDAKLHVTLYYALYRLYDQAGSKCHKLVVQGACGFRGLYTALGPEDDSAGVYPLVYHERCDARDILSVYHRPVYWSGAAVLRQ